CDGHGGPKKCHPCKKSRTGTQEKFARKFPYRFSWLAEPKLEPLQAWAVAKMNSSLREQLPLQKMLVPTRSIPVRGLGAPDFPALSSFRPPPPSLPPRPPPLNIIWELALLSRRFPAPDTHTPRSPSRSPALLSRHLRPTLNPTAQDAQG
uniref:Uncharacterized protein n=1 Tax=Sus scrofa TaxID=9823 RepID=A0A4X1TU32_PIG